MAIRNHLEKNGAKPLLNGSSVDVFEKDIERDGKLVGQKLIENPDNVANLNALLKSREKISIAGFLAATPTQMLDYYNRASVAQWQKVFNQPINTKEMGPLQNTYEQYLQKRGELFAIYDQRRHYAKGSPQWSSFEGVVNSKKNETLAITNSLVNGLSALDETRRSLLDPELQKLVALNRKIQEFKKIVNDPNRAFKPVYDIDAETRAFYSNNENKADLYEKAARAMYDYYKLHFAGQIPLGCQDHLKSYVNLARAYRNNLPPRAQAAH
jgi:hypothetical protein